MKPTSPRPPARSRAHGHPGRVIEIRGRRVLVVDDEGERVCFLSGQRVVVGDRVRWVPAKGEGGKVVEVERRSTELVRADLRGDEQVLAANILGVLVVATATEPPFRGGLVDRYAIAARARGLEVALCLNKVDLPVPAEVEEALILRRDAGIPVHRVSARHGTGLPELAAWIADTGGPWALVGHSGVGKTSIVAALLPGVEVGPIGALSEHWGTGQHTTTASRIFALPGGGEVVDSPGIRTFAPGRVDPLAAARLFPGLVGVRCKYHNCLHREGEEGCVAPAETPEPLLRSWRRLLDELLALGAARY